MDRLTSARPDVRPPRQGRGILGVWDVVYSARRGEKASPKTLTPHYKSAPLSLSSESCPNLFGQRTPSTRRIAMRQVTDLAMRQPTQLALAIPIEKGNFLTFFTQLVVFFPLLSHSTKP